MSAPASRAIRGRHVQYRAPRYRPSSGTTSRLAVPFPDRWAGRGLACSCTANGAWCRRSALNCIDARHSSRWCYAVPARHLLTVVKHRADAPCTNVPALARAPALCPKGDPCRQLRESVQATSRTDNRAEHPRHRRHLTSRRHPTTAEPRHLSVKVTRTAYERSLESSDGLQDQCELGGGQQVVRFVPG